MDTARPEDLEAPLDLTPPPDVIAFVPDVVVGTLAGSDQAGAQDGTGADARFMNPTGLALTPGGDLIVNDYDGGRVRRVSPDGVVTALVADRGGFSQPYSPVVTPLGWILGRHGP